MNNEIKECKHYCEGYYSDDIGYEETDKINACGLTRQGYHEMSYKECHTITNCYYKQLLVEQAYTKELNKQINEYYVPLEVELVTEQAKNSELDATLKILKINHKLTISELNNEQAKNKKMVEEKAIKDKMIELMLKEINCNYTGNSPNPHSRCKYPKCDECKTYFYKKQANQALNQVNNEK